MARHRSPWAWTFAFIDEFAAQARALGIEVLVEIHSHHQRRIEVARQVDWVYDFALPPPAELDGLVERIHVNSGGDSRRATGATASNLDLYQVNCTFYDALARDDRSHLLARAIQFFMPGVPQVYYVGVLAGHNDLTLLEASGVGRDINRHRYSPAEIAAELGRPVVARLLELIRLRNAHLAFGGHFALLPSPASVLAMRWQAGDQWAELQVDLHDLSHRLSFSDRAGNAAELSLG